MGVVLNWVLTSSQQINKLVTDLAQLAIKVIEALYIQSLNSLVDRSHLEVFNGGTRVFVLPLFSSSSLVLA